MLQIIDWSTSSFPLFYDDVCLSYFIFFVEHDSGGSGFYFTLILTESSLYFTFIFPCDKSRLNATLQRLDNTDTALDNNI